MNETLVVSMWPVVANALCCQVPAHFTFKMPKVVPDQREKYENDEFFRKLSRESEVRCEKPAFEMKEVWKFTCSKT